MKVKDKEIAGSPFQVFVKIPLTQLRQPVRTIDSLSRPWGIAINNKQQLVVAETGKKKITIKDLNGKKVQTIECDGFQSPYGVATGSGGVYYVTDVGAQCLFKFDTNGRLLKTVRNEFQKPFSVMIIQNRLYVVDCDNCLVTIFDMDCNVIGTIQTKKCPNPYNIALGPDSLYVAGEKISVKLHSPPQHPTILTGTRSVLWYLF